VCAARLHSCCAGRSTLATSTSRAHRSIKPLAAAYAAQDWAKVDQLVSDNVVRRHAACGTRAQIKAKLEEYHAIGLDELVIGGIDDAEGVAAALAAIGGKK